MPENIKKDAERLLEIIIKRNMMETLLQQKVPYEFEKENEDMEH